MENTSKLKIIFKRKGLWIIAAVAFMILSAVFISPVLKKPRSDYRSSELTEVITQDDSVARTDYVDDRGKITVAADTGYATKIVTQTDDGQYEEYFDAEGEKISRYSGYYGLFREYDEQGNNIRITYLDAEGNPVIIVQGYAVEERTYDDEKRVTSVRFLDTGAHPILTSTGYGKLNEYNDQGKVSRITYVDEDGEPMMIASGYASLIRNYYSTDDQNDGKVESEFYFDTEGNPAALSLGQYGVHKEYDEDGEEAVITYLDAEGNPMVTNKGYTTIKRTYQANGSIASEQYYDVNGEPYAIGEGQYGYKKENGQTTYLKENGGAKFNIRNLLYNHSWLVIVAAVLAVLISSAAGRKWNMVFLALCLVAIAYFTLMFRESGDSELNLTLFWSYRKLITSSETRADVLKNIWLFVPLGAILYRLYPKKIILLVPVLLSLLIELTQYVTGKGLLELDDVVSNGLGGVIGYYAANLLNIFKINSVFSCARNWIRKKARQLVKGE